MDNTIQQRKTETTDSSRFFPARASWFFKSCIIYNTGSDTKYKDPSISTGQRSYMRVDAPSEQDAKETTSDHYSADFWNRTNVCLLLVCNTGKYSITIANCTHDKKSTTHGPRFPRELFPTLRGNSDHGIL